MNNTLVLVFLQILVRATTEATEALAEFCRKNEGVVQGKIFLPHIGEVVDVTRESHIFQVRKKSFQTPASDSNENSLITLKKCYIPCVCTGVHGYIYLLAAYLKQLKEKYTRSTGTFNLFEDFLSLYET